MVSSNVEGSYPTGRVAALGAVASSPQAATDAAIATRPAMTMRRPDVEVRVVRSMGISS